MTITEQAALAYAVVHASINYLGDMTERPKFHAQDRGRDNLRHDSRVMAISDARRWSEPPSLEREGVVLVPHKSAVRDFYDPEQRMEPYLTEVEALIREISGAPKVHVLRGGGMIRYAARSPFYKTGVNTQTAHFPHIDFTAATAPGLADSTFGSRKVALRPGQRVVGYNIWRVVSDPPQDIPLAVCDARTVEPQDLVPADGVYDDGPPPWMELEAYAVRYNPRHRWLYFRDMRPDEALVFRAYDNLPGFRPGTPHTAFDDPTCPPDAPARVSVEARAFAVFDA
jgi:hypothetical protein